MAGRTLPYLTRSMHTYIGIDLGGTNVRAQALTPLGEPAGERFENPSHAQEGSEAILDAVAKAILQAAGSANAPVKAVGLAIAGHVDDAAGIVRWAPNFGIMVNGVFHYWEDVPVREPLEARTGYRIHMGNDANLAALGEYKYGTGRNEAKCLVMLTIGTGIGGGVVLSPASVQGRASSPLVLLGGNQGGGELGHVVVQQGGLDCTAGSYGALEAYCQRDSIIRRATNKLRRGRTSIVRDLVKDDLSKVTPRVLTEACNQGDAVALETYQEVGTYLGTGIGSFINVFAPDYVAIGGQISKAGEYLLGPARAAAQAVAIPSLFKFVTIQAAQLIDDAGILGGAALAVEKEA